MLNKMQTNRSIACGFVKHSKEVFAEFWNSLSNELNSAGPIKNVTEWKKVWTDQKRYIRSKAAINIKNQRGTGGGPNHTKYFALSFCNKENNDDINTELCSEKSVCLGQLPPSPQEPLINEEPTSSCKKNVDFLKRKREDQAGKQQLTL